MFCYIYRLSGASLAVPLINFWWRRIPQNLLNAAIKKLPFEFQMTLRVAHYCPWLLYWWMTQKWFPSNRDPKKTLTERDIELSETYSKQSYKVCVRLVVMNIIYFYFSKNTLMKAINVHNL